MFSITWDSLQSHIMHCPIFIILLISFSAVLPGARAAHPPATPFLDPTDIIVRSFVQGPIYSYVATTFGMLRLPTMQFFEPDDISPNLGVPKHDITLVDDCVTFLYYSTASKLKTALLCDGNITDTIDSGASYVPFTARMTPFVQVGPTIITTKYYTPTSALVVFVNTTSKQFQDLPTASTLQFRTLGIAGDFVSMGKPNTFGYFVNGSGATNLFACTLSYSPTMASAPVKVHSFPLAIYAYHTMTNFLVALYELDNVNGRWATFNTSSLVSNFTVSMPKNSIQSVYLSGQRIFSCAYRELLVYTGMGGPSVFYNTIRSDGIWDSFILQLALSSAVLTSCARYATPTSYQLLGDVAKDFSVSGNMPTSFERIMFDFNISGPNLITQDSVVTLPEVVLGSVWINSNYFGSIQYNSTNKWAFAVRTPFSAVPVYSSVLRPNTCLSHWEWTDFARMNQWARRVSPEGIPLSSSMLFASVGINGPELLNVTVIGGGTSLSLSSIDLRTVIKSRFLPSIKTGPSAYASRLIRTTPYGEAHMLVSSLATYPAQHVSSQPLPGPLCATDRFIRQTEPNYVDEASFGYDVNRTFWSRSGGTVGGPVVWPAVPAGSLYQSTPSWQVGNVFATQIPKVTSPGISDIVSTEDALVGLSSLYITGQPGSSVNQRLVNASFQGDATVIPPINNNGQVLFTAALSNSIVAFSSQNVTTKSVATDFYYLQSLSATISESSTIFLHQAKVYVPSGPNWSASSDGVSFPAVSGLPAGGKCATVSLGSVPVICFAMLDLSGSYSFGGYVPGDATQSFTFGPLFSMAPERVRFLGTVSHWVLVEMVTAEAGVGGSLTYQVLLVSAERWSVISVVDKVSFTATETPRTNVAILGNYAAISSNFDCINIRCDQITLIAAPVTNTTAYKRLLFQNAGLVASTFDAAAMRILSLGIIGTERTIVFESFDRDRQRAVYQLPSWPCAGSNAECPTANGTHSWDCISGYCAPVPLPPPMAPPLASTAPPQSSSAAAPLSEQSCPPPAPHPSAICVSGSWVINETVVVTPDEPLVIISPVIVFGGLNMTSPNSSISISVPGGEGAPVSVEGCVVLDGKLIIIVPSTVAIPSDGLIQVMSFSDYCGGIQMQFSGFEVDIGCRTASESLRYSTGGLSVLFEGVSDVGCAAPSLSNDGLTVGTIAGISAGVVGGVLVVIIIIIGVLRHRIIPAFELSKHSKALAVKYQQQL